MYLPLSAVREFLSSHLLVKGSRVDVGAVHSAMVGMLESERTLPESDNAVVQTSASGSSDHNAHPQNRCTYCLLGMLELDGHAGCTVCSQCGVVSQEYMFGVHCEHDIKAQPDSRPRSRAGAPKRLSVFSGSVESANARIMEKIRHLNVYVNLTEAGVMRAGRRAQQVSHVNETVRCIAAMLLPQIQDIKFTRGAAFERVCVQAAATSFACQKCKQPVSAKWEETRHMCDWGGKKRMRVSHHAHLLGLAWQYTTASANPPATGNLDALAARLDAGPLDLSIKEWKQFGIHDLDDTHVLQCGRVRVRPATVKHVHARISTYSEPRPVGGSTVF